jgi:hypothetical protein
MYPPWETRVLLRHYLEQGVANSNRSNLVFNIIYIMRSMSVAAKFRCPLLAKFKCPLL